MYIVCGCVCVSAKAKNAISNPFNHTTYHETQYIKAVWSTYDSGINTNIPDWTHPL